LKLRIVIGKLILITNVLRGFTNEVVGREGVFVHDFKTELIFASLSWILYLECEPLIPNWMTSLTWTVDMFTKQKLI
jgi:hypothetical protein